MKPNQSAALGLVYVALLAQTGCNQNNTGAPETKKPKLVFVTSGTNSFWQSASAGIEAAASDFNAEFEIVSSASSILDQWEPDGIAFAPINGDGSGQQEFLRSNSAPRAQLARASPSLAPYS